MAKLMSENNDMSSTFQWEINSNALDAATGGDLLVEPVEVKAAAVQNGVRESLGRHILAVALAVERAQVLHELRLAALLHARPL